jgi:hypothetical protein
VNTWPVPAVTTSDHKPLATRLNLHPSPPPPLRSTRPVEITISRLALIGEMGASPLLPKAHRVKVS